MQVYPVLLLSFISRLPETPRWFISHEKDDGAREALNDLWGEDEGKSKLDELKSAHEEESSKAVNYVDMVRPSGAQFHPTMITIMGQVNQALTGYGAVSVYGPQIFELLGFGVRQSEYLTLGNYVSYFFMMTFAWMYIDVVGRRILMVGGAFGIAICFVLLTLFGGLAMNADKFGIPILAVSIPGCITLYIATATFGIGWLSEVWLIPTEIFPSTARAQGSAVSVIVWGFANFAVTLLTPIGFNNLDYWLFLVLAATNTFAGWWTWVSPHTHNHRQPFPQHILTTDRHTLPKQAAAPLKRTKRTLMTPKNTIPGASARSTRASIGTCRKGRKTMVVRRLRCWGMGLRDYDIGGEGREPSPCFLRVVEEV